MLTILKLASARPCGSLLNNNHEQRNIQSDSLWCQIAVLEIYIDNPEKYDQDREKRLYDGDILDIEKKADDFTVKYLGTEYVAKGLGLKQCH